MARCAHICPLPTPHRRLAAALTYGGVLWHPVETSRRVRDQFQVDERRLDRGVFQPAAQVVDLDAVHQKVARIAVAQRVCTDPASGRHRTQLLGPGDRCPDPAPRRRRVDTNELTLADAPVRERRSERCLHPGASARSSTCYPCRRALSAWAVSHPVIGLRLPGPAPRLYADPPFIARA